MNYKYYQAITEYNKLPIKEHINISNFANLIKQAKIKSILDNSSTNIYYLQAAKERKKILKKYKLTKLQFRNIYTHRSMLEYPILYKKLIVANNNATGQIHYNDINHLINSATSNIEYRKYYKIKALTNPTAVAFTAASLIIKSYQGYLKSIVITDDKIYFLNNKLSEYPYILKYKKISILQAIETLM